MSTVKMHEQQPASPGSFNEFQQQLESADSSQEQPLIDQYTEALVEGSFYGTFEEFSEAHRQTEEAVATSALTRYTMALKSFRNSQRRSLPTEA